MKDKIIDHIKREATTIHEFQGDHSYDIPESGIERAATAIQAEQDNEDSQCRRDCRDYLMQVESKDLTVENCLEALGYGRNGLKFQ